MFFIHRIQEQYEEGDGAGIWLMDLKEKYDNDCQKRGEMILSHVTLGKVMNVLFPGVRIVKKTHPTEVKRKQMYSGLILKEPCQEYNTLLNSDNLFEKVLDMMPKNYIIMNNENQSLTLGLVTSYVVDGLKLIKEITLNKDLSWGISVFNTMVEKRYYGLNNTVLWNVLNLYIILQIVSAGAICMGKLVPNDKYSFSGYQQNKWGRTVYPESNTGSENRIRTDNCFGLLPLISRSQTCLHCCNIKLFDKKSSSFENKENINPGASADMKATIEDVSLHTLFPGKQQKGNSKGK
jgi:hypothetical protein